jgi:hypothetical protein
LLQSCQGISDIPLSVYDSHKSSGDNGTLYQIITIIASHVFKIVPPAFVRYLHRYIILMR